MSDRITITRYEKPCEHFVAVFDLATVTYHGHGKTRRAALAALWNDVHDDADNIEAETLESWLEEIDEHK